METEALLSENDLDVTPFTKEQLHCVPRDMEIPGSEFTYRQDLTGECVFTIDPITAKDLDDAISCREMEDGNLEVGVHISDVAFYLSEGTVLDEVIDCVL